MIRRGSGVAISMVPVAPPQRPSSPSIAWQDMRIGIWAGLERRSRGVAPTRGSLATLPLQLQSRRHLRQPPSGGMTAERAETVGICGRMRRGSGVASMKASNALQPHPRLCISTAWQASAGGRMNLLTKRSGVASTRATCAPPRPPCPCRTIARLDFPTGSAAGRRGSVNGVASMRATAAPRKLSRWKRSLLVTSIVSAPGPGLWPCRVPWVLAAPPH
mmetsp:Transcript_126582/g.316395  ORF Transcript_126582/g.316395 Transcript_126582/m.316395 type:complete len:218 (+) Transcript_126582:444-1097(+)